MPCRLPIALLASPAVCGALACVPPALAQAPSPPAAAGASLTVDPGALRGRVTRFRGALPDLPPGGAVQIQRLDRDAGWVAEATAVAGAGGTFLARWRPKVVGRFTVRAVAVGQQ